VARSPSRSFSRRAPALFASPKNQDMGVRPFGGNARRQFAELPIGQRRNNFVGYVATFIPDKGEARARSLGGETRACGGGLVRRYAVGEAPSGGRDPERGHEPQTMQHCVLGACGRLVHAAVKAPVERLVALAKGDYGPGDAQAHRRRAPRRSRTRGRNR